MALNALSPIIIAAEHQILPTRDALLQSFFQTIQNATSLADQSIKGKALMCAGNLAQACGDSNFPQEALTTFTTFALECLQQSDAKYELKETAINYFSEISKILKSNMGSIIPVIVPLVLECTNTKVAAEDPDDSKPVTAELELDSDEDDDSEYDIDLEGVDEQV